MAGDCRSFFLTRSAKIRVTPGGRRAWPILLALLAGLVHTLSFAPTPYGGWLEIATLTSFFILIAYKRTLRGTLMSAGAFGFSHFVSGVF